MFKRPLLEVTNVVLMCFVFMARGRALIRRVTLRTKKRSSLKD